MEQNIRKEIAISTLKTLFSTITYPLGVGQALNEILFDFRSRIKQERLNHFVELLAEFFTENPDIDLNSLKTEEFSDLFESVIIKVVQTKSKEKHKLFRDILISQIKNPSQSNDYADLYIDLISDMSESEINILKYHQVFDSFYDSILNEIKKSKEEIIKNKEIVSRDRVKRAEHYPNMHDASLHQIKVLEKKIDMLNKEIEPYEEYRTHKFYDLSQEDFLYCKQSLYSKGLLIDTGIGGIGTRPFERMGITEFGKRFIQFIISN